MLPDISIQLSAISCQLSVLNSPQYLPGAGNKAASHGLPATSFNLLLELYVINPRLGNCNLLGLVTLSADDQKF
jgi:hypothetical protein